MAVSRIAFDGHTLIDLTNDTATEQSVEKGKTFHKADGNIGTGTADVVHSETISEEAYELDIPESFYADVKKIGGKSVKWNQLAPQVIAVTGGTFTNGKFKASAQNNQAYKRVDTPSNNIFLAIAIFKTSSATNQVGLRFLSRNFLGEPTTNKQTIVRIASVVVGGTFSVGVVDTRESGFDDIEIMNMSAVNLTAIFGSGNEPTSVDDERIAYLKEYAERHPEYDGGSIVNAMVTEVKGTSTLQLPSITLLPDYGAGIGDVYNEIDMEPVVYHNMKAVDLGTLTWTTGNGIWYAPIADKVNNRDNIMLSKYGYAGSGNFARAQTIPDKCALASNGTSQPYVYIKDSTLDGLSPAQVKTALSGVILHYEATEGGADYAARLYHRRIAHRTIDGTQTLSVWKTYGVSTPFSDMKKFVSNNPTVGLCDRLANVIDANIVNGRPSVRLGWNSNDAFFFNDKNMTTTAEYAQWFANNPTTVFYELADEQLYDATPYIPSSLLDVENASTIPFENDAHLEVPIEVKLLAKGSDIQPRMMMARKIPQPEETNEEEVNEDVDTNT